MSENLLSNHIVCHCGKRSPISQSWWRVQDWWREHGYGQKCRASQGAA